MKHLKPYKIFEGMYGKLQYPDVADLKLELEDSLLDLRDDGFNTEVKFSKDYKMYLHITFLDYQSKTATWDDIKDYVERVNTMTDRFEPVGIYYKIMQPDGRVFNRNNRDFISWDDLDLLKFGLLEKWPEMTTVKKLCFFAIEYIEKV